MLNPKIKAYTQTTEGKAMFCIVREFLEFFDMDFTMAVYEPESYMGMSYKYDGKLAITKDLGLSQLNENSQDPLLLQLIRLLQLHNNNNTVSKSGFESCSPNSNNDSLRADNSHMSDSNVLLSESVRINGKTEICVPAGLNVTFDLSNPKIITDLENSKIKEESMDKNTSTNDDSKCNTINISCNEETNKSSACIMEAKFTENSISSVNYDKSDNNNFNLNTNEQNILLTEKSVDFGSALILKENKLSCTSDASSEKLSVVSEISNKLKTTHTTVADLTSEQIAKKRSNDSMTLPSHDEIDTKELMELSGTDLDLLDNYEEDFVSTNESTTKCSEKNIASGSETTANANNQNVTTDSRTNENTSNNLRITEGGDS